MNNPNQFEVPEGFEPVIYSSRDDDNTQPEPGLIRWSNTTGVHLVFYVTDKVPVLPFFHGDIKHTGWDIPTRWVIDANKVCWMDNAHGHPLQQTTPNYLIAEAEALTEKNKLRTMLGLAVVKSPEQVVREERDELRAKLAALYAAVEAHRDASLATAADIALYTVMLAQKKP